MADLFEGQSLQEAHDAEQRARGDSVPVFETVEIAEPVKLDPALQSAEVLAVFRDAELNAEAAGVPLEGERRALHLASSLLRRMSGIQRSIMEREVQLKLQVAELERFHKPFFDRAKISYTLLESALKAIRKELPFPKKADGSYKAKTIKTPYGSIGFKETGGKLVIKKDELTNALLDRWCVLNQTPALKVYRMVELTADELTELRRFIRGEMKDDPLWLLSNLPEELVVEREDANGIKAIAKAAGEIPDGMEVPDVGTEDVITVHALETSLVEAVDIETGMAHDE